jgi:DNA polymerase-3 subunit delta
MRLSFEQLGGHLGQALRPLYVLTGDEPLSMMESVDAIRRAAKTQGCEERLSYTVDRTFNWQQLMSGGQALSLFSSRRLLEIHMPSGKPGTEGSKALQEYCGRLPDDAVTLVTLPRLDGASQKSAWFGALEKAGVVVPLFAVELGQLPRWIGGRLLAQGQQADMATLEFLANQVEGNLLAAHHEIQKLGLLYPAGRLDPEAVREAVLNVSRHDVFQLGDAMLEGDAPRTARILQGLEAEGVQPLALLGVLAWLLRGIAKVQQAELHGQDMANAMRDAKIYGDRQTMVRRMLARVGMKQMQATLLKLAEIDKICKGIAQGRPWLEISRLCLGLARAGSRRRATA